MTTQSASLDDNHKPLTHGGIAGEQLKAFVQRVERITEEKKALAEDIKEVFAEAKGVGFDTKIMRKLIALRAKDPDDLKKEQALLETYMIAIGMV